MAEPEASLRGFGRTRVLQAVGAEENVPVRSCWLLAGFGGLRKGRKVYRYFTRYKQALAIISTGNAAVSTPAPIFSQASCCHRRSNFRWIPILPAFGFRGTRNSSPRKTTSDDFLPVNCKM